MPPRIFKIDYKLYKSLIVGDAARREHFEITRCAMSEDKENHQKTQGPASLRKALWEAV